ncbi:transcription elongation factor GreA [Terricaulis sp.]|uniref:transcription elongation factor GreA n=1 Tax=Terricaulis sp. TaxID=2768686 RepID=UPI0037850617
MSRAFVKDADEQPEPPPERPISPHRNLVTPAGLAAIEAELERAHAAVLAAGEDRDAKALAERDLRYWTARRGNAELVPAHAAGEDVRFGAAVTIERDGARQTYRIVGEDEADPAQGSISYVSPLARAMLGRAVGDVVRVSDHDVEIVAIG